MIAYPAKMRWKLKKAKAEAVLIQQWPDFHYTAKKEAYGSINPFVVTGTVAAIMMGLNHTYTNIRIYQ